MISNVWLLIFIAAMTAFASWLSLRALIGYLVRKNIVDAPNDRSLHQGTVPRGGGLVIVASVLLALVCVAVTSGRYPMFLGLFLLVLLWAILSWCDDRFDLSPALRFGAQIGIAILTIVAYGWVTQAQLAVDLSINFAWFGAVCTVIGSVWFANLYNFMDGLDGLAAAQTIIAATTIAFWFWQAGDLSMTVVCVVLAASAYGFLLLNWQPAKIFMGDVGSITLGAFFASLLVIGVTRYQIPVVSFVLLFSVFIVDASLTLCRRIVRGEKFWLPHRTHYYQRLAVLGVSHARVVFAAMVLMLLCSLIATLCVAYRDIIGTAILLVLGLMVSALVSVVYIERKLTQQ